MLPFDDLSRQFLFVPIELKSVESRNDYPHLLLLLESSYKKGPLIKEIIIHIVNNSLS